METIYFPHLFFPVVGLLTSVTLIDPLASPLYCIQTLYREVIEVFIPRTP